jgi:uridine kinase
VSRRGILDQLADQILSIRRPHPVRVAIDGIDAAGKTTLADALVTAIEQCGRTVIRATIDGFHRPRAERYRQGKDSPEGYYEDSFDYSALRHALLLPLGPDGSQRYRRAVFDVHADTPIQADGEEAPANAVLLFDGVFLLRPELDDLWEYRIFVDVDFVIALQRALLRDQSLFGSAEAVRARYKQRYFPGQRLYLRAARPRERANVVVDNNDLARPRLFFPQQPA